MLLRVWRCAGTNLVTCSTSDSLTHDRLALLLLANNTALLLIFLLQAHVHLLILAWRLNVSLNGHLTAAKISAIVERIEVVFLCI